VTKYVLELAALVLASCQKEVRVDFSNPRSMLCMWTISSKRWTRWIGLKFLLGMQSALRWQAVTTTIFVSQDRHLLWILI